MEGILNIISKSAGNNSYGGPNKVILNTIKGLEKINQPYVLNGDPKNFKFNWVHDSVEGLIEISLLNVPAIIGPNIAVLPSDLPIIRPSLKKSLYLHPSQWCVDLWNLLNYKECPLLPWAAGIDYSLFRIKRNFANNKNVMIYFKRRNPQLLEKVESEVLNLGFKPHVIKYGEYTEEEYKSVLSLAGFGIWLGVSESQGIGLQEALASGLPLIVCDVNSLFESSGDRDYQFPEFLRSFKPTSAPYFDKSCGILINNITKLHEAIVKISTNLSDYSPTKFIRENLSLEKQATELLSFFDILERDYPLYFKTGFEKPGKGAFKQSFLGRILYLVFLTRRKLKTGIKILKSR